MAKIVCVSNQKGGVGKTSIAFNLAKILADDKGCKVLAIDNDHQANLTCSLIENPDDLTADVLKIYNEYSLTPQKINKNLDLIGSTLDLAMITDLGFDVIYRLKEGIDPIKNNYDYIIIDCHPDFGYLHMAALTVSDFVLIPTKASPYAIRGLKVLFDTVDKARRRLNDKLSILGIIINLMERTSIANDITNVLRDTYGSTVFNTVISKAVKVEESPSFLKSITEYEPVSKPAEQFKEFVNEFLNRINGGQN